MANANVHSVSTSNKQPPVRVQPATPLPWKMHGEVDFGSLSLNGEGDYAGEGYSKGDAAYLLHVANAYPKLIERLKAVCGVYENDFGVMNSDAPLYAIKAHDLLKRLGEAS